MNKNIIVLVNEINADYSFDIIEGIDQFYKDKDVNLIIFPVRNPNADIKSLDIHFWSAFKILSAENIDAIIVLTPIFCSNITKEYLTELIQKFHCKNIVSLSIPLDIPNSVNTYVSCQSAYDKIIEHLKNEHNCTKIAFMSANSTGSLEAQDRYNSFLKAMTKNHLIFDENLLFEGNFVYDVAFNALLNKYAKKEEIDFDAIVCANDMMSFGCMDFFMRIGMKVPEEMKIIGYDDITQTQIADISLSTINQNIQHQGKVAAQLALDMANGKSVPKETKIEISPIFRHSCGCKPNLEESSVFMKAQQATSNSKNALVLQHLNSNVRMQNIFFLLENLQKEVTLDQLFKEFTTLLPRQTISSIAVCLYKEPVINTKDVEFAIPDEAKLVLHINQNDKINKSNMNVVFNPTKSFIPNEVFPDYYGLYMFHPIFFGNKQFGYFICKLENRNITYDLIYQKVYSDIISQAYIYSEQIKQTAKLTSENLLLQMTNTELSEQSSTDSLTGVFNRRGFLDAGQEAINLALKMHLKGLVCFGDMNYLKKINDTYGHNSGDLAIQTIAEIFQTILRKNDVIGRLGGDEFAAVLPGLSKKDFKRIKNKISILCTSIPKVKNLPFDLSISIGVIEFSDNNRNINELLKIADKKQYIEKHKIHAQRD